MSRTVARPAGARAPSPARSIPGPGRRGALRRLLERRRDPLALFARMKREHGDLVHFRLGHLPMYQVTDPELVEQILVAREGSFRKGRVLRGARDLLGDGLLTAEGGEHRRRRALVAPGFHRGRIAAYAEVMARRGGECAAGLRPGEVVDVRERMTAVTMAVVAETLFGADVDDDRVVVDRAVADVLDALVIMSFPLAHLRMRVPTERVRAYRRAGRELGRVVDRIVAARRARGEPGDDLLGMLLTGRDADGGALDSTAVREEVMTLFTAGLETTANALAFGWWELAGDPAAEGRLHAEIDALGRPAAGLDDLARLPYCRAVVSEALRMHSPAWALARRALEPVDLGGHRIPEGALVQIPLYLIHRDERWFPEPERFRPERFLPDGEGADASVFRPFGDGARRCIGATFAMTEATLLLARIARERRLQRMAGSGLTRRPLVTLRAEARMRVAAR